MRAQQRAATAVSDAPAAAGRDTAAGDGHSSLPAVLPLPVCRIAAPGGAAAGDGGDMLLVSGVPGCRRQLLCGLLTRLALTRVPTPELAANHTHTHMRAHGQVDDVLAQHHLRIVGLGAVSAVRFQHPGFVLCPVERPEQQQQQQQRQQGGASGDGRLQTLAAFVSAAAIAGSDDERGGGSSSSSDAGRQHE
jgi:hypothetical protein